jgi:hypothetical protein
VPEDPFYYTGFHNEISNFHLYTAFRTHNSIDTKKLQQQLDNPRPEELDQRRESGYFTQKAAFGQYSDTLVIRVCQSPSMDLI